MSVDINLWAVLLAGVSSMVIGMLYYADQLFGKQWKKLAKIDEKRFQKEMPRVMPMVFVAALITAYVVAYVTFLYQNFFDSSWISAGVVSALVLWLGAAATTVYVHNSLDQRPASLTAISLGNRLLSILAMGLIVGWLHP
jgi:Protein of unknown function (DUF1761)